MIASERRGTDSKGNLKPPSGDWLKKRMGKERLKGLFDDPALKTQKQTRGSLPPNQNCQDDTRRKEGYGGRPS